MGTSQTSGREADREKPPWTYNTGLEFACMATLCVGSATTMIAAVAWSAAAGEHLPPVPLILTGMTVLGAFAFPLVMIRLQSCGSGTISADGIEYRPVLHDARRVRWDQVESVQWLRWRVVLRGGGTEVTVRWAELLPKIRGPAREWVRSSLAPAFQLTDAPKPPERTTWTRILLVSVIAACPMLLAWERLLHDFYGNRSWIWVFLSPLPLSFLLAFAHAYRDRNRFRIWYHRRSDSAAPPDPLHPPPVLS
ncbi:MAG: hypothetical protein AVDCRST_MAG64-93 [uncultured Phycisphaerae bacterium]|uniref:PH domain-containing protein n=1 Tax=uncultured Phycisphaerae bacterium TaxID=904963 RepID=A0A6J4N2I1_9BACT|nr:MAG: hypothetical protein AVDCRST_MAG64-93 [uncultured Phycisphaerae bacterium]